MEGRAVRRGGWTLADHVVSSGANFLLTVLLARRLPASEFGAFALLYGYYVVCVQLAQTTCAEPLMVRFPHESGTARAAARASAGAAAAFGLLCSCALLPLARVVLGGVTPPVLVLMAVLPLLLVQSALRIAFIAAGQPRRALVSDVAWGLGQCAATVGALSVTTGLTWIFVAWGFGGLLAAALAMAQAGVLPSLAEVPAFLREYGDLARPYLAEGIVLTLCGYATLLVVGKIAGLAAAGALRAADTLFGPANVVIGAGRVIGISELSRLVACRPRHVGRGVAGVAVALGAVGAVTGIVAMALPESVGRSLFGASWAAMVPLLAAVTVYRTAQGAVMGPSVALRALQAVRALFVFRIVTAIASITAASGGACLAGAGGAVTGLAVTMTLSCVWATVLYARYRHGGRASVPAMSVTG